jgi:hypothetical protein
LSAEDACPVGRRGVDIISSKNRLIPAINGICSDIQCEDCQWLNY